MFLGVSVSALLEPGSWEDNDPLRWRELWLHTLATLSVKYTFPTRD